jgi:hypothetical protein
MLEFPTVPAVRAQGFMLRPGRGRLIRDETSERRKMTIVDEKRLNRAGRAAVFFLGISLLFAFVFFGVLHPTMISAGQNDTRAKESTPDLKPFVGTWKASFKGEVFAILVLKEHDGSLTGTLNNFDLSVDKEGNLLDGTHKDQGEAALLNPHFKSGALVFVVMQKDQYYPSTQFSFVPTIARAGELTPSANNPPYANSGASVKPIPMVRERSKPE